MRNLPFTRKRAIVAGVGLLACAFIAHRAFADLDGSYVLPADHAAIQYSTAPLSDPVSELRQRLRAGQATLEYDPEHGYLPAILRALKVPISSQVLVFSKTSFQAPRIAPRTPRALYFNDNVSVGFVKGGDVVELAAVDPKVGVVFYTVDQEKAASPALDRRGECLQCHASGGTLGVPGFMVRSIFPEASGMPLFHAGGYVTDHRSPLSERWGGWYVTGTHGSQRHMGNAVVIDKEKPRELDTTNSQNVTDLKGRFDTGAYLAPDSDIVALMTLEHQTRMVNLITRVGYETRMALYDQRALNKELGQPPDEMSESAKHRIDNAAAELVRYMMFEDEAPLTGEIKGTTSFAADFAKSGPKDHRGRGLREFDLHTRLLRYPCSYLIYSEQFDALPSIAKDSIYRRTYAVLTGKEKSKLSPADRAAILEILLDTKPGLPAYWKS
jgi:hypothetical protein